MTYIVRNSINL